MSASISSAICRKIAAVRMSLMDFARRRHRAIRFRMFAIVSFVTTGEIACSYSRSRRARQAQTFCRPSSWSHRAVSPRPESRLPKDSETDARDVANSLRARHGDAGAKAARD